MTTTFEDDVRAMLARRAADIAPPAAGEVPPLPTGLRVSLDAPPPDRRRSVLLVAAVVVLLLGAVGVVFLTRADGDREHTGPADAPTRPTGPVPDIPGLPQGLTTEDLLPLWTDPPGADRLEKDAGPRSNASLAFNRYLRARIPSGFGSSSRYGEVDGFPDWYRATFMVTGPSGSDARSDEATAYLWWSGESWSVMAVLSSVHSFTQLVVDRSRVEGTIYGDGTRRAAGLGEQPLDLRIDRWQDRLAPVGESPGGDVGIVVGADLPDGPTTLLVAPVELGIGVRPPTFSELAFDPADLAEPGPTTVPTIPGHGQPGPGIEVEGVPVGSTFVQAVDALLPEGEEPVGAQRRHDPGDPTFDVIEVSTVIDEAGYEVTVSRTFHGDELGDEPLELPWGRVWIGVTEDRSGIYAQTPDGWGVHVANLDRHRTPASVDFLLALTESVVEDPTVVAVARGADPAG